MAFESKFILPEERVGIRSLDAPMKGEGRNRSPWRDVVIPAYVRAANFGMVQDWPNDGDSANKWARWYNDTFDERIAVRIMLDIERWGRQRTYPFKVKDIKLYIVYARHIVAQFMACAHMVNFTNLAPGRNEDLPDAMRELLKDFIKYDSSRPLSSDYTDSIEHLARAKTLLEPLLALPQGVVNEIARLTKPFKPMQHELAPICIFAPVPGSGVKESITGLSGGFATTRMFPTPRQVRQKVELFTSSITARNITSLLKRVYKDKVEFTLPAGATSAEYDAEMSFLWSQSGFSSGSDRILPNIMDTEDTPDSATVFWNLLIRSEVTPTEFMMRNMTYGRGKEVEEVRGFHLSNLVKGDTGDISGTGQKKTKMYSVADPTSATSPANWNDLPTDVTDPQYLMQNEAHAYANLGWQRTIYQAEDDVAPAVADQNEGTIPAILLPGERYRLDYLSLEIQLQNSYEADWPLSMGS